MVYPTYCFYYSELFDYCTKKFQIKENFLFFRKGILLLNMYCFNSEIFRIYHIGKGVTVMEALVFYIISIFIAVIITIIYSSVMKRLITKNMEGIRK